MDVLGEQGAVDVFLALGGSEVEISYTPHSSRLVEVVGVDKAAALGRRFGRGQTKVPLAKAYVSQVLWQQGVNQQEIARRLHVDVATVARHLKATPGGRRRKPDDRQIELF
ncbi:helix-turn-helix domain-containing protein [Pleomorphomonas koreensis]|uniref:helix-turn-helix domain-containing protein n=1 Tax=Pleomorphomonas koreensis TaxID=257440 RepID=UPI00069EB505|nr:helix-turn-helix domain-containing protein [Pleomorphomonas koreensis]